ncbi:NAD+ synthase [Rhodospirillum sp. A1_3_36]|uniref:NAD+ synthase n=1 Tax=Rhodospirillum sp. A1_3_36 TaxID=3391666 RepID=UPI0039A54F7B
MTKRLSIALCQINPTVGDIPGNRALIRASRAKAQTLGADLAVFPELCLTGYPPEDLVLRDAFLDWVQETVEDLARETADGGPALLVGAPWREDGQRFNAALLLDGGVIAGRALKHHLPNYGVFDEKRVFDIGPLPDPIPFRGAQLGVLVCEDMWFPDVAGHLAEKGADMLVIPNGSPYDVEKDEARLFHARGRVAETNLPLLYVNQICGQDELVFDGASFVVNGDGELRLQAPRWAEDLSLAVLSKGGDGWSVEAGGRAPMPSRWEDIYQAMTLGLRDYVTKNGFPGVVLGLSGGIDSAISAAVAVDALGADKVHCVMMPSPYTSRESLEDAAECARLLGTRLDEVNIGPAMEAFDAMLAPVFAGQAPGITEENIQSRSRGLTLMAISNKLGPMLLTTGNKSEMSVGYATLYGDMCGGYSVLKDVYKTTVFALCRWRNAHKPVGALGPEGAVMPERVITKPPSAELRPDQKDEDSLPPYDELDLILHMMIEEQQGISAIVSKTGLDRAKVERVWTLLQRAEYKRRQAPPGVKITELSFGRERRYPLTNAYKG